MTIVKNPNFINEAEFYRSLQAKGRGAEDWPNSHTEVEYLGNSKFAASIGVGHRVFFDKADGNKPKKHKLTDERPNYVLLQSAKCCVEVYPYYAKYFDVQHEEVRLYEERWVVQRLFKEPDDWWDVDAYNPVITVEEYPEPAGDVIKVTVTYDTDYGILTVEYFQRDGNNLKHNVTFKNTSGATETFRVVQVWAGIVANKVTTHREEHKITTETLFNTTPLIFGDDMLPFKISNNLEALKQKGVIDVLKILTGSREQFQEEATLIEKDGLKLTARNTTLFLELDGRLVMTSGEEELPTIVGAVEDCPEDARVFIGGLGLGVVLLPLSISGKANEVLICESDSRIIDVIGPKVQAWFPELNITIVHGDIATEIQNHGKFDWIFIDTANPVSEEYCSPYLTEKGRFTDWISPKIQEGWDKVLLTDPIRIDLHPKGLKANLIIGDWVLAPDESLAIDPDSATLGDPTEDGWIKKEDTTYTRDTAVEYVHFYYTFNRTTFWYRGYVEWDISGIPNGLSVTKVEFRYEGEQHPSTDHSYIRAMANQPSAQSDDDAGNQVIFDDIADGTIYLDDNNIFPEVGTGKDVGGTSGPSWDTDPKSDVETALAGGWFAFGFKLNEVASGDDARFYSEEKVVPAPADPPPTLYIEYTLPAAGSHAQAALLLLG